MKKLYSVPEFKVVEINEADIICTSPDEAAAFSIDDEAFYEEEKW